MNPITRRQFAQLLAAMPLAAALPRPARAAAKALVVVIGGGYGGATAAKYIRMLDPGIEVTLIERNRQYVSCPFSNEVLAGERDLASLTWGYEGLQKRGVKVIHDEVVEIDGAKRSVRTRGGQRLGYDRLVVAPGIDFDWGYLDGLNAEAEQLWPHAYKAGEQTLALRKRLEAMPDGGTCIISVPPRPFRCPPGPYERACQIAHYFKHHKPKSRVLILDSNDSFSKKALFEQAWAKLYPGMIQWVSGADDGRVQAVDLKAGRLMTNFGEHKAEVVNFIPKHHAGHIARQAGLTDTSGWCPVAAGTLESTRVPGVHVIGDACIAGEPAPFDMPKSAHAALTQAKAAAQAIVAAVNGLPAPEPYYANTCYSLAAPDWGFSVVHVFRIRDGQWHYVREAGGTSDPQAPRWARAAEAEYAVGWYDNIARDAFA